MILLTGGSGFLGQNILKVIDCVPVYFKNKIDNGVYADLTNPQDVYSLFNHRESVDSIIHCAACPSPKHPENVGLFLEGHIKSTVNLLEESKPGSNFIYISSILVYGDSYPEEIPSNLYGACKLSCEKICQAYAKLKNLNLTIIRPCAIVGEGLTHGLVYDIQRKLKSESKELELFGDRPGTIKPFVHVDDIVTQVELATYGMNPQIKILDCFPEDSLSVEEVAEIVMNKLEIHKPIKWLGDSTIWKGDNRHIDTSKKNPKYWTYLFYHKSKLALENSIKKG
jgi:nucleoside-diphosphate-sugar epimerase